MMKSFPLTIRYLVFLLFALCIFALQATAWSTFLPKVAGPLMWLTFVIHFALHRNYFSGLFQSYGIGALVLIFTAAPLKMMLTPIFICYSLIYLIKDRIYWRGSGYLAMVTVIACSAYHISFYVTSKLTEDNPTTLLFLDRLTQIILTPAFAVPFFSVLGLIDLIGKTEHYQTPLTQGDGHE